MTNIAQNYQGNAAQNYQGNTAQYYQDNAAHSYQGNAACSGREQMGMMNHPSWENSLHGGNAFLHQGLPYPEKNLRGMRHLTLLVIALHQVLLGWRKIVSLLPYQTWKRVGDLLSSGDS